MFIFLKRGSDPPTRLGSPMLIDEKRLDSVRQIHAVELHDAKGHYNKHIKRIINGNLLLIKEMLSDGDEWHNEILDEVKQLENALIKLLPNKT